MKILVTGANGQLGTEIRKRSVRFADFQFIFTDIAELDITDWKAVDAFFEKEMPDVLINCAAYTAVDKAEGEEKLVYDINAYAVGYLASVAKDTGALLVHFSTDYVFDGENHLGYKEEYPIKNPATIYGKSKKLAEKLIEDINPRHFIIRTQWLFGSSGKNFIETMLGLAGQGKELKVVNDQFGSPTYAKDLAGKVREMIEENRSSGIYHVTNSETCSWYDFALEIFALANLHPVIRPVKSEEFAAAAKRPTYSMLINTKLPPLRSWQDALRAYLIERGNLGNK